MPALTIKNIPDDLYGRLKESARAHRRSLSSEVLCCVERMLSPYKFNVSERIANARKLREKTTACALTDEFLEVMKKDGRL